MRLDYICVCLLALFLSTGATNAQGFSLQHSTDMASGAFDDGLLDSLLGAGTSESFPWFGPEFSNTSSAYSFLSEFYINTSEPMMAGFTPVKIDITRKMPSKIYFGSGREVAYTQYQTAVAPTRGNELWIQKGADWSQYAIVPADIGLQLIAFAPAGGQADYYEIVQTDSLNITSKRVNFYPGYNSISFVTDKVGRHILLFVQNNQPSQAVIVDVISEAPFAQQTLSQIPSVAGQTAGSIYGQIPNPGYSQPSGGLIQNPPYATAYTPSYVPQTGAAMGDTPVTIQTPTKGYSVYVDGVYVGEDGANGDPLDGVFRFTVVGGQTHTIRVFDGINNYEKPVYFERGVAKIINVPPATTVYTTGGL